jgi:hypothetical protein
MTVKSILKKVALTVAYGILMAMIGFGIATAMYSAGMQFTLPKIKIEYENKDHDLILIDRSDLLGKAVSDR